MGYTPTSPKMAPGQISPLHNMDSNCSHIF